SGDWSSDVCSSDLTGLRVGPRCPLLRRVPAARIRQPSSCSHSSQSHRDPWGGGGVGCCTHRPSGFAETLLGPPESSHWLTTLRYLRWPRPILVASGQARFCSPAGPLVA